jgi:hypothetical protein
MSIQSEYERIKLKEYDDTLYEEEEIDDECRDCRRRNCSGCPVKGGINDDLYSN